MLSGVSRGVLWSATKRGFSSRVLGATDAFKRRHIGPSETERDEMLSVLGFGTLDELSESTVPANIRHADELDLVAPMTESEATTYLKSMADKNKIMRNYIGMGYYGTITPAVVRRNLIEDPSWYTSYTPYQPEISQGRLEM
jgi:glycine dehydrogenase